MLPWLILYSIPNQSLASYASTISGAGFTLQQESYPALIARIASLTPGTNFKSSHIATLKKKKFSFKKKNKKKTFRHDLYVFTSPEKQDQRGRW